jgi:hypothetical protein
LAEVDLIVPGSASGRMSGGAGADSFALAARAEVPTDEPFTGFADVPLIQDFVAADGDRLVIHAGNDFAGDVPVDAPVVIIGGTYDGTNSGVGSGAAVVIDGAGGVYLDRDVGAAGYSVLARVESGAADITAAHVIITGAPPP